MTLRLKRGTDEQRLEYVFEEGELVYTTDTKRLYVGDGTTLGGLPVSGSDISIDQISEFNIVSPQNSDVLVFNAGAWTNTPLSTQGIVEGSNYRINIVGEDSSLIVDSSTNTISGGINTTNINTPTNLLEFSSDTIGSDLIFKIMSNDAESSLFLERKSELDISGDDLDYGRIAFGRFDINGSLITSVISSTRDYFLIGNNSTGTFTEGSFLTMNDSKFGFGTFAPTEKIDVRGNGIFQGSVSASSITSTNFVQFGSITNSQRDALSPTNGMVIYNSTVERFQGYQNGAWINLDNGSAA